MYFAFRSSHVRGDFSDGRLIVDIQRQHPATGVTTSDDIYFEVPPDFHVHNDLVAAALLTLVGNQATRAEFNSAISEHCAATLRRFYGGLEVVGPIDPGRAPRRRGRYYGLNFSGGLDSTAVWLLLRELLGDEFRTITTEYGDSFAFEARGYTTIARDVSCRTDFREKRYDRAGRFNSCATLLFADYLDLRAQVTGHPWALNTSLLEALRDGRTPRFLTHDLVLQAGGLDELHLIRSLANAGPLLLLVTLAPERARRGVQRVGSSGNGEALHQGLPAAFRLRAAQPGATRAAAGPHAPRRPIHWGESFGKDTRVLQIAQQLGQATALQICPGLRRFDLAALNDLSLRFLWRYNSNMLQLIPAELRRAVLEVFHRSGLEPYDEADFAELDRLRGLLVVAGVQYDPTTPANPPLEQASARPGG